VKSKSGRRIALLYGFGFLMSNGPGLLLVKDGGLVGGVPTLYLWSILWFAVQFACLCAAFLLVWKGEDE
jgi:hypothetical protein